MIVKPEIAKMILKPLCENGTPPNFGLEHFSSGFEDIIKTLTDVYLDDIILKKGSSFKFISASFGGGKTHLVKQFREKAWEKNYVTCYVTLDERSTQFHKLLTVFQAIINHLQAPLSDQDKIDIFGELKRREELGLSKLLKEFYFKKKNEFKQKNNSDWEKNILEYINEIRDFDSIYFGRVIRNMLKSLVFDNRDDFENLEKWFDGELLGGIDKKFDIKKIPENESFRLLQSLSQLITEIFRYRGLILFFDETEQHALRSKDKDIQIANLRQIIDKCGDQSLSSILFFYTVPNAEEFLQSKGHGYDAIKQRLEKLFSQQHPLFPNVNLEKIMSDDDSVKMEQLQYVGNKLGELYRIGYNTTFPDNLNVSIGNVAKACLEQKFGQVNYRRLFIQSACEALGKLSDGNLSEITPEMAIKIASNQKFNDSDDDDNPSGVSDSDENSQNYN